MTAIQNVYQSLLILYIAPGRSVTLRPPSTQILIIKTLWSICHYLWLTKLRKEMNYSGNSETGDTQSAMNKRKVTLITLALKILVIW